jgi:CsoR family transcriptional regulator, copper-sensing transcriptional repressor
MKVNDLEMIPADLITEFSKAVKTATRQLEHIDKSIGSAANPEELLLQLKAAHALVAKATILLLDEVYRKALAEKISFAHQNCPGDCGYEEQIERLRQMFPHLPLEELPRKLVEADDLIKKMGKIISENTWSTPPPMPEIRGSKSKKTDQ